MHRSPDAPAAAAVNDAQSKPSREQRVVDRHLDAHESVGHRQTVEINLGGRPITIRMGFVD